MKPLLFALCAAALLTFSFCKKQDVAPQPVKGSMSYITWEHCVQFEDQDLTVCFVGAEESRCPCTAECVWEGVLAATLRVSTLTGIDTSITLMINSNPANLPNTAVVAGKVIRLAGVNIVDCNDFGDYEKYKVLISVE